MSSSMLEYNYEEAFTQQSHVPKLKTIDISKLKPRSKSLFPVI